MSLLLALVEHSERTPSRLLKLVPRVLHMVPLSLRGAGVSGSEVISMTSLPSSSSRQSLSFGKARLQLVENSILYTTPCAIAQGGGEGNFETTHPCMRHAGLVQVCRCHTRASRSHDREHPAIIPTCRVLAIAMEEPRINLPEPSSNHLLLVLLPPHSRVVRPSQNGQLPSLRVVQCS